MKYEVSGYATGLTVGEMITLGVGVGIIVLVFTFVGVLGGSAYQSVESDISSISNTTIKGYISDAIASSFKGLKTAGGYVPLLVLAVIIGLVLSIILGLMAFRPVPEVGKGAGIL